jgi:hypothetical protein
LEAADHQAEEQAGTSGNLKKLREIHSSSALREEKRAYYCTKKLYLLKFLYLFIICFLYIFKIGLYGPESQNATSALHPLSLSFRSVSYFFTRWPIIKV